MSTKMISEINSSSSEETERLAEALGRRLKGGEVIELVSDLGGGKTTFTKGLARGIGSEDHVTSPTFKVCNVYKGKNLTMYHYDFYRLGESGLIAHELSEALEDPQSVIVVEWAQVIEHVLPNDRLVISIQNIGESGRKITYSYSKGLEYLAE